MKKLLTTVVFAVVALLFTSSEIYSQRTVSGTIIDSETNEPLIGANVLVKGTSTGTITDIDGNFSLSVPSGSEELEISYAGFSTQSVAIGNESFLNIGLSAGQLLDEIVVTGYGSQNEKEITSAVAQLDAKDFNLGAITDPAQLLQGKVAGLQIYNRGGDPNGVSTIRMRGISTVGANVEPLIVIDGIIGASLNNVDPNDIESVSILKDGSAAAIYGSRGSSGVIIVTTKSGDANKETRLTYNGQIATSSPVNGISVMSATDFVAAGGTDLGSQNDWLDEVTRAGLTHIHGLSASGGFNNTSFRISANVRDVEGILLNSGFDQFNTRLNLNTKALNDKLSIDFNTSYTTRQSQIGFQEALRYAVLYNPTAPILGDDSPFPFNSAQFGGYFETLGLFDSFNPVSIATQNRFDGDRQEFNYGANFAYSITDALTYNVRVARQSNNYEERAYYPTTSNFRGNASSPTRKGLAGFYDESKTFNLYETFATYLTSFGASNLTLTGGYSYQQENYDDNAFSIGDFPNNDLDFSNIIESAQDLQNAGFIGAASNASPDDKIIAFFGRANLNFDDKIFVNASLRREGSSKLGVDNQWGLFPAFGVGIDLNQYLNIGPLNKFKVRYGWGLTGALPSLSGLSREIRNITNDASGAVNTTLARAANPDLKWEEKGEHNLGFELGTGRLGATLDIYKRTISDFILERTVDVVEFQVDRRYENAGQLSTKGLELSLDYDVIQSSDFTYNTGIVFNTFKTILDEYVIEKETRANLGAPGQNGTNVILVKEGEEIGQIWGPVYVGVTEGNPDFEDVNGDGVLVTGQDKALEDDVDFKVLGKGTPDFEIGWTNQISYKGWNLNAFFRGAFGHSLVNTFRAFYEPQLSTQSSYNYINTELAVEGLTTARFSSLYVEKADFFKLDNLTIGKNVDLPGDYFDNVTISLVLTNPIVLTSYTGTDPEPSLVDRGPTDNGNSNANYYDVLSPGLDRRNNYFSSRSIAFGINLNF